MIHQPLDRAGKTYHRSLLARPTERNQPSAAHCIDSSIRGEDESADNRECYHSGCRACASVLSADRLWKPFSRWEKDQRARLDPVSHQAPLLPQVPLGRQQRDEQGEDRTARSHSVSLTCVSTSNCLIVLRISSTSDPSARERRSCRRSWRRWPRVSRGRRRGSRAQSLVRKPRTASEPCPVPHRRPAPAPGSCNRRDPSHRARALAVRRSPVD